MDISYLDKLIPQRWVLLLRYYLPFFKKPALFYFKVRKFINKLKKIKNYKFNLAHLSNFLLILGKYPQPDPDDKIKKISISLIDSIIFNNLSLIEENFIELLNTHKPETDILTLFLSRLPKEFFEDYIPNLYKHSLEPKEITIDYEKQLQWCSKLIAKFTRKAKIGLISFIASMDNDLIKKNFTLINTLVNSIGLTTLFNQSLEPVIQKNIFWLMLTYNTELNVDKVIFFQLFNNLLAHNPKKFFDLLENILPIQNDEQKNIIFLKAIMNYTITTKSQKLFESILKFYHKEFILLFINQLITDTFNHRSDKLVSFSKHLLKNKKLLPLNLFQELSLYALTKENLNIDRIIEIYSKQDSLKEIFKTYSLKLQNFTLEATIISIKNLITTYIVPTIPKKPQRYSLHNQWDNFIKDEWLDSTKTKSQELESIIEKMPENIKDKEKTLFVFLIHLCQIAECPEIKEINTQEKSKYEKEAREYENRKEAQRALTLRISYGQQTRVSYQRMEELFGSQSVAMQKQWEKKVLFFDANDPEEHKAALLEAEQNKKVFNQIFL